MKHLHTLIKLKKREVDVLRKQLGHLTEQREFLEQLHEMLENDLTTEVRLSETLTQMSGFFGQFSDAIKKKQALINEQIRNIDRQMDIISEQMRVVFSEQKTYEIVLERKKAEAIRLEEKREQEFMDELSSRKHGNEISNGF